MKSLPCYHPGCKYCSQVAGGIAGWKLCLDARVLRVRGSCCSGKSPGPSWPPIIPVCVSGIASRVQDSIVLDFVVCVVHSLYSWGWFPFFQCMLRPCAIRWFVFGVVRVIRVCILSVRMKHFLCESRYWRLMLSCSLWILHFVHMYKISHHPTVQR